MQAIVLVRHSDFRSKSPIINPILTHERYPDLDKDKDYLT